MPPKPDGALPPPKSYFPKASPLQRMTPGAKAEPAEGVPPGTARSCGYEKPSACGSQAASKASGDVACWTAINEIESGQMWVRAVTEPAPAASAGTGRVPTQLMAMTETSRT